MANLGGWGTSSEVWARALAAPVNLAPDSPARHAEAICCGSGRVCTTLSASTMSCRDELAIRGTSDVDLWHM